MGLGARALICCGVLMLCSVLIVAQSGRRLPKTSPAPPPEATEQEEEKPKPSKPPEPTITLIVGVDELTISQIPPHFFSTVLGACENRLRDSGAVRVEGTSRSFNRGDAVKRAKAEKEAYVVLLELQSESFGRRQPYGNVNIDDLYVGYTVFAPVTAKNVTAGRTYPQTHRRVGVLGRPRTGTGVMYAEYLVKEAAREAAERILAAFHIKLDKERIPATD